MLRVSFVFLSSVWPFCRQPYICLAVGPLQPFPPFHQTSTAIPSLLAIPAFYHARPTDGDCMRAVWALEYISTQLLSNRVSSWSTEVVSWSVEGGVASPWNAKREQGSRVVYPTSLPNVTPAITLFSVLAVEDSHTGAVQGGFVSGGAPSRVLLSQVVLRCGIRLHSGNVANCLEC